MHRITASHSDLWQYIHDHHAQQRKQKATSESFLAIVYLFIRINQQTLTFESTTGIQHICLSTSRPSPSIHPGGSHGIHMLVKPSVGPPTSSHAPSCWWQRNTLPLCGPCHQSRQGERRQRQTIRMEPTTTNELIKAQRRAQRFVYPKPCPSESDSGSC